MMRHPSRYIRGGHYFDLYPILPKGLPEPTKKMIKEGFVYVGEGPLKGYSYDQTINAFVTNVDNTPWIHGKKWHCAAKGNHCCIHPGDLFADKLFNRYQRSKGVVMNDKINPRPLKGLLKDHKGSTRDPLLTTDKDGAYVLCNEQGGTIARLAEVYKGMLLATPHCKGTLEEAGFATDWAHWNRDGSIKSMPG